MNDKYLQIIKCILCCHILRLFLLCHAMNAGKHQLYKQVWYHKSVSYSVNIDKRYYWFYWCDSILQVLILYALCWGHNGHDGVSKHHTQNCLLKRLFRCRSKKTSKLRITGLCEGNSPVTSEFPAKKPEMQKNFPFDDVIMMYVIQAWPSLCLMVLVLVQC